MGLECIDTVTALSIMRISRAGGCLAQLGERRPYKPKVAGSTPATPTIRKGTVER